MITGAQIRSARAMLGWSQGTLAEKSKVSETGIANIERGASRPLAETLDKIQRAFERAKSGISLGSAGATTVGSPRDCPGQGLFWTERLPPAKPYHARRGWAYGIAVLVAIVALALIVMSGASHADSLSDVFPECAAGGLSPAGGLCIEHRANGTVMCNGKGACLTPQPVEKKLALPYTYILLRFLDDTSSPEAQLFDTEQSCLDWLAVIRTDAALPTSVCAPIDLINGKWK
jgi:transcriptional regulator with XRE-family HTH domain